MIDFSRPIRFRGTHAAYVQYLCTERKKKREGGVNIYSRVMDAYLAAVIIGLKYGRTAVANDDVVPVSEIFGETEENKGKNITSSEIMAETVHSEQVRLNYLYRLVMLCEDERGLSDEEKIANAFKSEGNQKKIDENIELMNKFARGGVEILYDRFRGLAGDDMEIAMNQIELFDEVSGYESEEDDEIDY